MAFLEEERLMRSSYDDKVLSADLVEDHLADVLFVEGGGHRNVFSLVVSAHQQVGFIYKEESEGKD